MTMGRALEKLGFEPTAELRDSLHANQVGRRPVRVIDSPDMPLWIKPGSLETINALDQLRKEPELEWCFLSPSAELRPGQRTGKFRLGNDQLLVNATGQSKISVQDYAVAMIETASHP